MTKFRKKPVIIDAIQFHGTAKSAIDVFDEFDIPNAKFIPCRGNLEHGYLIIPTLEGKHVALDQDWIIRGIVGEFYPCKPDVFDRTYEEIQ